MAGNVPAAQLGLLIALFFRRKPGKQLQRIRPKEEKTAVEKRPFAVAWLRKKLDLCRG